MAALQLVGNTPLLQLDFTRERVSIFAKAEFINPSGSVKDRLAKGIILDAEAKGMLKPGSTIVECTSGNTGIALAMVGVPRGYRVKIVMSASASVERRSLLKRLGAELVLFDESGSYETGIEITKDLASRDPSIFLPRQFENPLNAEDHQETTGQEIIRQSSKPVDAFVSGYGTGGTISGVGNALKRQWPAVQVIAMEPTGSALPGEFPCCHRIEGIAQNFEPPLLKSAPIDRRIQVAGLEAMEMTRRLHRELGLLVGTSSGANVVAALATAEELGPNSTIVTILCDRAERYFSTALFADDSA